MLEFQEKTGAAHLSLDQLRRTMALGDFSGKMPASVPLVHSELLDTIVGKAKKAGLELTIPPLVIRERYCNKKRGAIDNEPENYIVNRMVGKIQFGDPHFAGTEDQMRPAIAFSYVYDGTLRGIQVSFGQNVDVCDNLTVFGEFTFSTNGNKKVPFDKGLQLMDGWMQNYATIIKTYNQRIEKLKAVEVSPLILNTMVGDLFTRAVRQNVGESGIIAPMNQSEVSAMVQKGSMRLRAIDNKPITGWDVMNWGTEVLKPQTSDMTNLISSTAAFNDYVYEALCVPIPSKDDEFEMHNEGYIRSGLTLPATAKSFSDIETLF